LPDIPLEPDEAAAVGIAARLWRHAGLAAAASSGLAKLRASGIDIDPHATLSVEPVVTVDPAFVPLAAAARERRVVTFDYRVPEKDAPTRRRLQPWGAVCWRGRWYVVGHDLDRDAPRCFRLSRIVGAVKATGKPGAYEPPTGVDLISHVARWSGPVEHNGRATVVARPGRAAGLRRWAKETVPDPDGDRLVLAYADAEGFAGHLVGYGADVRVIDPPEVREMVIQRLKEIATRHEVAARL
jgi:proteasome accessory factor B